MFTSKEEMVAFHDGIDSVFALFPHGEGSQVGLGLGTLAASVARVHNPQIGYDFLDAACFDLDLPPDASFHSWRKLGFIGVHGALEQARLRAGITEKDGCLTLRDDLDLKDIEVGDNLISLVAAGDHAVIPMARGHHELLRGEEERIYSLPNRAYALFEAGDKEALDIALQDVDMARAHHVRNQNESSSDYSRVEIALKRIASWLIKKGPVERLDEVLGRMDESAYKAQALAEVYAAGLLQWPDAAEQSVMLLNDKKIANSHKALTICNTLVAAGFPPAVDSYKQQLIDPSTRIADDVDPSAFVALYKAGEVAAADQLVELSKGRNPERYLRPLKAVGYGDYAYQLASRLYQLHPSRLLLKDILAINFTTEQWTHLWGLPIENRVLNTGDEIYYRANDVRELAEHLSGAELHFEPR